MYVYIYVYMYMSVCPKFTLLTEPLSRAENAGREEGSSSDLHFLWFAAHPRA